VLLSESEHIHGRGRQNNERKCCLSSLKEGRHAPDSSNAQSSAHSVSWVEGGERGVGRGGWVPSLFTSYQLSFPTMHTGCYHRERAPVLHLSPPPLASLPVSRRWGREEGREAAVPLFHHSRTHSRSSAATSGSMPAIRRENNSSRIPQHCLFVNQLARPSTTHVSARPLSTLLPHRRAISNGESGLKTPKCIHSLREKAFLSLPLCEDRSLPPTAAVSFPSSSGREGANSSCLFKFMVFFNKVQLYETARAKPPPTPLYSHHPHPAQIPLHASCFLSTS
jgi:hypothetical protein